jgi:hypothetical protein
MRKNLLPIMGAILIVASQAALASAEGEGGRRIELRSGWMLKSSKNLTESGEQISRTSYAPDQWMPATVPGTVLTSYVKNGIYPDPCYDVNNKRSYGLIPDAHTPGSVFTYDHWYRTGFALDSTFSGRTIWLNLNGINYQADIYLNGQLVGTMTGSFKRGLFDITDKATIGDNALAIRIHQLPHPGDIKDSGCGGDNTIGLDAASMQQVTGWDFTFVDGVRDRNMGIIRDVYVYSSGPVLIRDPFMITKTIPTNGANLQFKARLINSANVPQSGTLLLDIEGTKVKGDFTLQSRETKEVVMDSASYPGLRISKPRLWWPNLKGEQHMYNLTVSFATKAGVSDAVKTKFGIRHIEHDTNYHGQPVFYVNGKRIFLNGGAWVQDAMLRATPQRYEAQARMMAQAGLNWLRLWSGSGQEEDAFYEACDKYGLMLWVESGLTAQTKAPTDPGLHNDNWRDTILRIRNHPCVFYYCGCNEGGDIPGMAEVAATTDGTRGYQANSATPGQRGCPYTFQRIFPLYDCSTTDVWGAGPLGVFGGFCNESGNPCTPPYDVLIHQMPPAKLWPIDEETFRYQDGGGFHNTLGFVKIGCRQYGDFATPDMAGRVGAKNWAFKGQILGAMQYRADSELWHRNKWDADGKFATGYAFWVIDQTHPQTCGRIYNYSLEPNASLFYFAHGNKPLHAQYDYFENCVSVVNDNWKTYSHLKVRAEIRNLDWSLKWTGSREGIELGEDQTINRLLAVPGKDTEGLDEVHFIHVELLDRRGEVLDEMLYWRSKADCYYGCDGPFTALNTMPAATLNVRTTLRSVADKRIVKACVSNPGPGLAFFTRLKIVGNASGELVQPCFYTDNYFSLAPGQSKTVTLEFDVAALGGEKPVLGVEGWNIGDVAIDIPGSGKTTPATPLPRQLPRPPGPNENLALSKFGKGTCAGGASADMAFDGSTATEWISRSSSNEWIYVDLAGNYSIGRVKLQWGDSHPASYVIEVSDDAKEWRNIHTTTRGRGDIEEIKGITGKGRFVRLRASEKPADERGYSLKEFEVYAAEDGLSASRYHR